MESIGNRIKKRRLEVGLSVDQVAEKIGKNRATVYRYESSEIEKFPTDILEPLANALYTTPAYLMGWEDENDPEVKHHDILMPLPRMKEWKVIGGTACGSPIHREIEEETVLAPADIDADRVFRCIGDSMIGAHIFDGDLVFVKTGEYVEDGKIGVVRIGDEYSLKRIYRGVDYLELRSENPAYSPIVIRGEQENAEIVGKAVHFLSRVI